MLLSVSFSSSPSGFLLFSRYTHLSNTKTLKCFPIFCKKVVGSQICFLSSKKKISWSIVIKHPTINNKGFYGGIICKEILKLCKICTRYMARKTKIITILQKRSNTYNWVTSSTWRAGWFSILLKPPIYNHNRSIFNDFSYKDIS